ncbi:MAG: TlpA family protein disulfide reductase [Chloroflexi bacterium]|nr:TlpA family protein disulfide reductase [Chloroflexota bacterium]
MTVTRRSPRKRQSRPQILAMALVGAGLFIVGLAGWAFLLKDAPTAAPDEASAVPMLVNYPAPELSLTDLQGSPVSLADYRGQVVLVNNWATWCPPCKAEMPALLAFYEDHKDQNFTIIAIESGEPVYEVEAFVKEYDLTFPVWPDVQQKATTVFRNPGLPSSYVINEQGSIVMAWTGAISRSVLEKNVAPLLED